MQVRTSQIVAGNNDRKVFDQAKLQELADSIREHGLAQPITVRPLSDGTMQIVAGERRFRAMSQILHWETVPALVREMNDEDAAAVMLAENTSRADLNPVEEANAYQTRIDQFGWTEAKLAEVAGVSTDRVHRRLSLLSLADDVLALVASGQLPIGHAEAMIGLDTNRQRIALRVYSKSNSMSLRMFRAVVADLLTEQSQDALFDIEHFWVEQVEKQEIALSGKRARVDVPRSSELPQVEAHIKDSVGDVMSRYIDTLMDQGYESEAAAVGAVFERLVKGNWVRLPALRKN